MATKAAGRNGWPDSLGFSPMRGLPVVLWRGKPFLPLYEFKMGETCESACGERENHVKSS